MVYMQFELLCQRLSIFGHFGIPGLEVRLGQLEDPEAAIRTAPIAHIFTPILAFPLIGGRNYVAPSPFQEVWSGKRQ